MLKALLSTGGSTSGVGVELGAAVGRRVDVAGGLLAGVDTRVDVGWRVRVGDAWAIEVAVARVGVVARLTSTVRVSVVVIAAVSLRVAAVDVALAAKITCDGIVNSAGGP